MLAPVQKPRRLPAADAKGGPLGALCDESAQTDRASLASPGSASGARNQGDAVRREGCVRDLEEDEGRDDGEDRGPQQVTTAVLAACPLPDITSL